MKAVDYSGMIVIYNFVIGVLIMLSSEKIASLAGNVSGAFGSRVTRYTRVSTFAFGTTVAVLSGLIYLLFHVLRLGVE